MAAKLNIKGTRGKTYDLDTIVSESRLNPDKILVVQVYKYTDKSKPNPDNLTVGQMWLSFYNVSGDSSTTTSEETESVSSTTTTSSTTTDTDSSSSTRSSSGNS